MTTFRRPISLTVVVGLAAAASAALLTAPARAAIFPQINIPQPPAPETPPDELPGPGTPPSPPPGGGDVLPPPDTTRPPDVVPPLDAPPTDVMVPPGGIDFPTFGTAAPDPTE